MDEEKAADEKLTSLAEGGINKQGARSAHGDDYESEDDEAGEEPADKSRSEGSASAQTTIGKKASPKR